MGKTWHQTSKSSPYHHLQRVKPACSIQHTCIDHLRQPVDAPLNNRQSTVQKWSPKQPQKTPHQQRQLQTCPLPINCARVEPATCWYERNSLLGLLSTSKPDLMPMTLRTCQRKRILKTRLPATCMTVLFRKLLQVISCSTLKPPGEGS